MPYQSRGFWFCDYCKATLDSLDEAKYHEQEQCLNNPHSKLQQQQQQQQQQPLQHHYPPQRGPLAPGPPIAPHHRYPYPPPAAAMAPLALASQKPEGITYEHSHGPADPRTRSRSILLMGPNEMSHMNADDTITCQNIEVLESGPEVESVQPGQLSIRCIHCVSNPTKNASVLPPSCNAFAESVQMISDRHLQECSMAPAGVREMASRAAGKRRRPEQGESSYSWQQEDELSRRALQEWCHMFCQRMGIADRSPSGSGITFAVYGGQQMPGRGMNSMARRGGRQDFAFPQQGGGAPGEGYYGAEAAACGRDAGTRPDEQGRDASQPQMPQQRPEPSAGFQRMNAYAMGGFPFFQDQTGSWNCKFCSHIPPQYRDPHSIWSAPNQEPPSEQFVNRHMSVCHAFHQQSMQPQPPMYQGPSPGSKYAYMQQQQFHGGFGPGGPHQGWEGQPGQQNQPMSYPPHGQDGGYVQSPHQMMPPGANFEAPHRAGMMGGPSRIHAAASAAGSQPRLDTSDAAIQNALDHLASAEQEFLAQGNHDSEGTLVLDDDKLLLTWYFFWLMKQLRLCRFGEADRKTRGGKREKIKIGFGGLQCVHCSDANNSRKFFWSNVDRLANSFAEIPGHVLKCRHCPQQTKDALFKLKSLHPEQMARLPRGSQKVFFRRMWRRLHDGDPDAPSVEGTPPKKESDERVATDVLNLPQVKSELDTSPGGNSGSDESILLLQRSTEEAARALAESVNLSSPPSPNSRILLAIPEDKQWLSDTDCFIRRQIEVFCATKEDVAIARSDRKYPVHEGQVGIRCIHCALLKQGKGASGSAVAYPFSISGIYEAVREFQRLHLDSCVNLPKDMKERLAGMKGSTSLSSVLRKYYLHSAKALGLQDTRDGIRSGGASVPLGSQPTAFAFSEGAKFMSESPSTSTPVDDRKRKAHDSGGPDSSGAGKRSFSGVKKEM